MMIRLLPALALSVVVTLPAAAQRACVKGKPCGNTCINVRYTCRVGTPPPPPPSPSPAASSVRSFVDHASSPERVTTTPAAPIPAMTLASHCSTSLRSIQELLLVADTRPSATIGRNLETGAAFFAPPVGDTTPVELLAVRCPDPDTAILYVLARGQHVALDTRSTRVRSVGGESPWIGNVRVRVAGLAVPGVVWIDAFHMATLQADR